MKESTKAWTEVPLRNRCGEVVAVALVDETDWPLVAGRRWSLRQGYAGSSKWIAGKSICVLMHRLVLGLLPGDGLEADHISRDRLDNRRSNLRVVTHNENRQNMGSRKRLRAEDGSLPRGVAWHKTNGKWLAHVQLNGVKHHLGVFDDPAEAGRAVAEWRAQHMPFSTEGTAARMGDSC